VTNPVISESDASTAEGDEVPDEAGAAPSMYARPVFLSTMNRGRPWESTIALGNSRVVLWLRLTTPLLRQGSIPFAFHTAARGPSLGYRVAGFAQTGRIGAHLLSRAARLVVCEERGATATSSCRSVGQQLLQVQALSNLSGAVRTTEQTGLPMRAQ